MSYSANQVEIHRRAAVSVDTQGSKTRRFARGAADEIRAGDQSQSRQGDRPHESAVGAVSSR